ncbi:three-Cys-motif partner protein TcmP [Curtobacterium sp. MCBD17_013]|uniref:three-Cys-motif partner protein TcmP n=1 Tax=Curtobacterium sp. MCBD17_013 TaxID=2175668 RepID=UPI0015E8C676|nr:three-Cys-motif partner protein TcmP [Curtobacterium sp. MCBD17_013]
MVSNATFFSEDKKAAAVLKHGVLRRHLAIFAGALSTTAPDRRVGFLDGYAGEGEYFNPTTGRTAEGSPRIALNIAQDLLARGSILDCVFVEKDKSAFAALESVVSSYSSANAVAYQGDIGVHLGPALARFANVPALVFLDPFGSALDHETTVNAILKRDGNQPTELLLNFSLQALRRMGARIWEEDGASGRRATLDRVDAWLGGQWWRQHFLAPEVGALPKPERANAAAEQVARAHRQMIAKATGCISYAVPIRRNANDKALFILTLFCPRRLALAKFNECVSLALKDWRAFLHDLDLAEAERQDAEDPQLYPRVAELQAVFAASEEGIDRAAIDAIKASIVSSLAIRSSFSMRNDFALVMGDALGVGRTTHVRAAWKELAKEGQIVDCPKGDLEKQLIRRP